MKKLSIMLLAWACYIAFVMFVFPYFTITALLYSVPLTMLGGWLYKFKGANSTTFLTIPAHYYLLNYFSDDPVITMEAFNPFGIGTQLLLSNLTAWLKYSQEKYCKLNESLEVVVAEKTSDLSKLTHYLAKTQIAEYEALTDNLLQIPLTNLKQMHKLSDRLLKEMESKQHRLRRDAEKIKSLIEGCILQMHSIENLEDKQGVLSLDLSLSLQKYTSEIRAVSQIEITASDSLEWAVVSKKDAREIFDLVKEAVDNALKHAMPSRIQIGIENHASKTILYVESNGRGFPDIVQEGMGMPLMRCRAEKVGGKLKIRTTDANTTRIECEIPNKQLLQKK